MEEEREDVQSKHRFFDLFHHRHVIRLQLSQRVPRYPHSVHVDVGAREAVLVDQALTESCTPFPSSGGQHLDLHFEVTFLLHQCLEVLHRGGG